MNELSVQSSLYYPFSRGGGGGGGQVGESNTAVAHESFDAGPVNWTGMLTNEFF